MGLREHGLNSNTRDSILDSYSDIIPDILANFILEPQDAGRLEETVYSIVHKTVSKLTGLSSLEKFDKDQLLDVESLFLDVESLKSAVEDFSRDYAQNLRDSTVRWKSKLKKKGDFLDLPNFKKDNMKFELQNFVVGVGFQPTTQDCSRLCSSRLSYSTKLL